MRASILLTLASPLILQLSTVASGPGLSDWSDPQNLGDTLNTPSLEGGAFITKDGLSLYIASNRPGGAGGLDIWVSQRDRTEEPWSPPQNLGPIINTAGNDATPMVSPDGHNLYFASDGRSGAGAGDLYVSWRPRKRDDFGWTLPTNLGPGVNTAANDTGPWVLGDRLRQPDDRETGAVALYFNSDRGGNADIFVSMLQDDGTFGPAVGVPELNTASVDQRPSIRRDGRELFFDSDRPDGLGLLDIWVSRRESTRDPWGQPENLGPTINSAAIDGRAAVSFDGLALYFQSTRPGGLGAQDNYVSTRCRLRRSDCD